MPGFNGAQDFGRRGDLALHSFAEVVTGAVVKITVETKRYLKFGPRFLKEATDLADGWSR